MLYLLPDEQKKKVLREYRMRLAVVTLATLSFVGGVSIALIIPTKAIVSSYENILNLQKAGIEDSSNPGADQLSKKIADISNTASYLTPLSRDFYPSEIVAHLEGQASTSVTIKQFQITHFDENAAVNISGVAKNRDSLIKFINVLKQDTLFSGASLPYGSLAKQDNLEFTLNLVINIDKLKS